MWVSEPYTGHEEAIPAYRPQSVLPCGKKPECPRRACSEQTNRNNPLLGSWVPAFIQSGSCRRDCKQTRWKFQHSKFYAIFIQFMVMTYNNLIQKAKRNKTDSISPYIYIIIVNTELNLVIKSGSIKHDGSCFSYGYWHYFFSTISCWMFIQELSELWCYFAWSKYCKLF